MVGNGFIILDEKDWETMTDEQKGWAMYKTLKAVNDRLTCLEQRPFIDKFYAFFGGIIGGFSAALGLKFLGT
jgi:hypothetical protein